MTPEVSAVAIPTEKPKEWVDTAPTPPPPFQVPNRSRAQRVAKVLYGPTARVWLNRVVNVAVKSDGISTTFERQEKAVVIGTEVGQDRLFQTSGDDFSDALKVPVLDYINQATSYADAKKRINTMYAAGADVSEFAETALSVWPEYDEERKKLAEKKANPIRAKLRDALRGGKLAANEAVTIGDLID